MLVIFKSKSVAEIIMLEEHAKPILSLIHKNVERGVITVEEAPAAIAKLEAAIPANGMSPAPDQPDRDAVVHDGDANDDQEPADNVSFARRAYPLLEMLRAAHKNGNDIVWGV